MYIETELDYRKTGCRLEKKKVERDRVSDVRGKKTKKKVSNQKSGRKQKEKIPNQRLRESKKRKERKFPIKD